MQENSKTIRKLYSELRLFKMSHYKQTIKKAKKQLQLHVLKMCFYLEIIKKYWKSKNGKIF